MARQKLWSGIRAAAGACILSGVAAMILYGHRCIATIGDAGGPWQRTSSDAPSMKVKVVTPPTSGDRASQSKYLVRSTTATDTLNGR